MKFSIRELLLLTVIVAFIVALVLDRSQLAEVEKDLARAKVSTEKWQRVARGLSDTMNRNGWTVEIDADGTTWKVAGP